MQDVEAESGGRLAQQRTGGQQVEELRIESRALLCGSLRSLIECGVSLARYAGKRMIATGEFQL